jgi:hypothetical protein
MTRFAAVVVAVAAFTLPCDASAPQLATKTKAKPRVVLPNPPPILPMQIPPTIREPLLSANLVETILFPDRALAEFILDWARLTPAHLRMKQLLNESEDL